MSKFIGPTQGLEHSCYLCHLWMMDHWWCLNLSKTKGWLGCPGKSSMCQRRASRYELRWSYQSVPLLKIVINLQLEATLSLWLSFQIQPLESQKVTIWFEFQIILQTISVVRHNKGELLLLNLNIKKYNFRVKKRKVKAGTYGFCCWFFQLEVSQLFKIWSFCVTMWAWFCHCWNLFYARRVCCN